MFDPIIPVQSVVQRASLAFRRAVGKDLLIGDLPAALRQISAAMQKTGGIVIGEDHGIYSHADFVTDFMPFAGQAGADRLYVELFHQRNQKYVDRWQDDGDPDGLIWLMNVSPSYSEFMWQRFWQVLQAAKDNGLRVVTIEPDKREPVYPGTSIFFRNMKWEDAIRADQAAKDTKRPFVLYCGMFHLDRRQCANTRPIHLMLDAAGVKLGEGGYCLYPPTHAEGTAVMTVPRAFDQTPLSRLQMYRGGQIQYKGNSPR